MAVDDEIPIAVVRHFQHNRADVVKAAVVHVLVTVEVRLVVVGYVESSAGEVYVEADVQVGQLRLLFERLSEAAMSPEESAELITTARKEL